MRLLTNTDNAEWHDLLARASRAERDRERLMWQVIKDHDENHPENLKWCSSTACRTAAEWIRC